jgi:hypothetical protein
MDEILTEFLARINQLDRQLHATQAELVATLSALRFASDPERLARMHEAERQAIASPPELDDPDFLSKRLAEYQRY